MNKTKNRRKIELKGLRVRIATSPRDILLTASIAREAHEESWFKGYPYSETKREAFIFEALAFPERSAFFIASVGSKVTGVLYCRCEEYILGSSGLMTNIYGIYIEKDSRKSLLGGKSAVLLMKSCLEWSKQRKSTEVLLHATANIENYRSSRFFQRANMKYLGGNYSILI